MMLAVPPAAVAARALAAAAAAGGLAAADTHPDSHPPSGASPARAIHPAVEPQPGTHHGRGPIRPLCAGRRSAGRLVYPARSPAPHRTRPEPRRPPPQPAAPLGRGTHRGADATA